MKTAPRHNRSPEGERLQLLQRLLTRLELPFHDYSLLDMALTHSSYINEKGKKRMDNQRLEYLGDSVLGLVVNEHLYHRYPDYNEGELARIKSLVVSEESLAEAAFSIRLGDYLRMGRGERSTGGADRPSNVADALEALFAAVYLDQGMEVVRQLILGLLKETLDSIKSPGQVKDAKSALQESIQKRYHVHPLYQVVSESGPHHKKEFVCQVVVQGRELARGRGSSRKRAEQSAALAALQKIRQEKDFPQDE